MVDYRKPSRAFIQAYFRSNGGASDKQVQDLSVNDVNLGAQFIEAGEVVRLGDICHSCLLLIGITLWLCRIGKQGVKKYQSGHSFHNGNGSQSNASIVTAVYLQSYFFVACIIY